MVEEVAGSRGPFDVKSFHFVVQVVCSWGFFLRQCKAIHLVLRVILQIGDALVVRVADARFLAGNWRLTLRVTGYFTARRIRRIVFEHFLGVATHLGANTRTNVLGNLLPVFTVEFDGYTKDKGETG